MNLRIVSKVKDISHIQSQEQEQDPVDILVERSPVTSHQSDCW